MLIGRGRVIISPLVIGVWVNSWGIRGLPPLEKNEIFLEIRVKVRVKVRVRGTCRVWYRVVFGMKLLGPTSAGGHGEGVAS